MKKINKNLLERVAKKSDHTLYMHATLIIKGGRLLAQGYNKGDEHSEYRALDQLNQKSANRAIAINFMIRRKTGTPGNSAPCSVCERNLRFSGLKGVIFFNGENFVETIF